MARKRRLGPMAMAVQLRVVNPCTVVCVVVSMTVAAVQADLEVKSFCSQQTDAEACKRTAGKCTWTSDSCTPASNVGRVPLTLVNSEGRTAVSDGSKREAKGSRFGSEGRHMYKSFCAKQLGEEVCKRTSVCTWNVICIPDLAALKERKKLSEWKLRLTAYCGKQLALEACEETTKCLWTAPGICAPDFTRLAKEKNLTSSSSSPNSDAAARKNRSMPEAPLWKAHCEKQVKAESCRDAGPCIWKVDGAARQTGTTRQKRKRRRQNLRRLLMQKGRQAGRRWR